MSQIDGTKFELDLNESEALIKVLEEYKSAVSKFGPFNSAHEGWAVLKEEVDELWDEVKKKQGTRENIEKEAIQVAAMGLRFVVDICLKTKGFQ